VLIDITRLLDRQLRASDRLGRWGGDECIVVAPETSRQDAQKLAERLRTAIKGHPFGPAGYISASFGVAVFGPGDSNATLIKRADAALYQAKARGKNRVEFEAGMV
jgi:diguanylate cyclase (GGDEF)-like protein